jgi:GNAT superfamily N-acetyltransferase
VIRAATPADADRIVEMAEHFLAATPYGQFLPAQRERLLALVDPVCARGVILLADAPKPFAPLPVGLLAIYEAEHPFSGTRYGDELIWWVEPVFRGRVGVQLLEAGEQWAADRGLAFLKMVAPHGSEIGHFYERRGYRPIETAFQKPLEVSA